MRFLYQQRCTLVFYGTPIAIAVPGVIHIFVIVCTVALAVAPLATPATLSLGAFALTLATSLWAVGYRALACITCVSSVLICLPCPIYSQVD